MIKVTESYLPDKERFIGLLNSIWSTNQITNRGKLINELESKLRNRFDLDNLLITTNGTISLQLALKTLDKGEVITTPFSYVATTSSVIWENFTPVFVDINRLDFNIDVNKIEKAITPFSKAILATHVFGIPCNVEAIDMLAKKYNLKVIYDAAHCFDVRLNGKSIFNFGDISICSFHATKLFHTAEGGAIFCKNSDLLRKISQFHNFGHSGYTEITDLGINGKIDEFRAAIGLSILDDVKSLIEKRKIIFNWYLNNLKLDRIQLIQIHSGVEWNYSYFPILLKSQELLLKIMEEMNRNDIYPRRYFYPALNQLPYVTYAKMPVAEDISSRVLCLPFHHNLNESDLVRIVRILNKFL